MRAPQAEDGHHRVADELLDRAAVRRYDFLGDRVVARQQRAQVLRIQALAQRGRARYVGEENGDDTALVAHQSESKARTGAGA